MIFLFFSKSNSKLIPYILPIFPPLAILIAHRFSGLPEGRGRGMRLAALALGCTLSLLGIAALCYANLPEVASLLGGYAPRLADSLNQFVRHAPQISSHACLAIGILFLLQGVVSLVSGDRKPGRMLLALCLGAFCWISSRRG